MKKIYTILLSLLSTFCLLAGNTITYQAASMLTESGGQNKRGFRPDAFNVPVSSHTFADGQGTITFAGELTSIDENAFWGCTFTAVTIPSSVTNIGYAAFCGCTLLRSFTISKNVKSIGQFAFSGCSSIMSLSVPSSVLDIGRVAFQLVNNIVYSGPLNPEPWRAKCVNGYVEGNLVYADATKSKLCGCSSSAKGTIVLPNTVKVIKSSVFHEIKEPISVVLPNGLTTIDGYAFSDCSLLTSITIPASVKSIASTAFCECPALAAIYVDAANPYFSSIDGVVYNKDKTTIVRFPPGKRALQFSIPTSVTTIAQNTFDQCKHLPSIAIPNSVTRIENNAFDGCTSLASVVIPSSVTYMGKDAFIRCFGLKYVILPNSVTQIGADAFAASPSKIYVPQASFSRFKSMAAMEKKEVIPYNSPSDLPSLTQQLPLLTLVPNSLKFIEYNANKSIDASEPCEIVFELLNKGKGPAYNCMAKIRGKGSLNGLSFGDKSLHTIAPGESYFVHIPIIADMNTVDGVVTFTIEVTEPNGYGVDPMKLTVNTNAFDAPMLKIVDYAVSGNGTIQKKQPFKLQLLLQNINHGVADNVDVTLAIPEGVSLWEGQAKKHFPYLNGGEQQKLNYELAISGNYSASMVPIQITIKERYGKYAENKTINLELNQQLTSATSVTLKGQTTQREAIAIGTIGSAVDRNIPESSTANKNTFAVIIANESYMSVAPVPYALNDGLKFREYCQKTLGIPEKNIRYVANATGNQLKAQITWLENVTAVFDLPNIIFYYAGHGIPDESSKTAYLLPVDGVGSDVTTGYKLDDLYASLGRMPAARTMVFLDACFSGSKREEGMLTSTRSVALRAKSGIPQGNMVVFSAAQGNETAYPNNEQGHGMFTYFLLKKLQATGGDVTLQDLGNYISVNVSQESIITNGKSQTPSVTASSLLGDSWKNWKLK